MSTITLPNIRVSSDLTVKLKLKDGGVAIDWSTLTNIRVSIFSDAQRALAGRCSASIDAEDSTLLVCTYAANKPQYVGVNRVVVSAKYMDETKTYDKPAFNFVRWTDDQEGETITIDDPDIDVEISVEDVSSSILQEAVDAANTAAERANEAAEAAEHMVDIHTGPAGKSPYIGENGHWYEWDEETDQYVDTETNAKGDTGETPDITIGTVTTAEPGTPAAATMTGTPEDPVLNLTIPKGAVGATPNFTVGTVTTGAPGSSVIVTITGTAEAPVLNVTIPQGMQGNTGSSVDYPYELVNNLTTNDSTKGLSAAQGVVLDGKVSQLEAEIGGVSYTETKVTTFNWTDVKYIYGKDGSVWNESTCRYCTISVGDAKKVRFLGLYASSARSSGFAFYDENGNVLSSETWKQTAPADAVKDYIVDVPENATTFKCTSWNSRGDSLPLLYTDFYCYLITGNSVMDEVEEINGELHGLEKYYGMETNPDTLIALAHCYQGKQIKVPSAGTSLSSATMANADNVRNARVPVSGATSISYNSYQSTSGYGSMFVDSSDKVISGKSKTSSDTNPIVLSVPPNAKYFIFSYYVSNSEAFNHITVTYPASQFGTDDLEDGAVTTQKIADGAVTNEKLAAGVVAENISGTEQDYYSYNHLDLTAAMHGYINQNNGKFVSLGAGESTGVYATDFIAVQGKDLKCYCARGVGNDGGHAVYDANKAYLRSTTASYTYQEGDAYVRFTFDYNSNPRWVLEDTVEISGAFDPPYIKQVVVPFNGGQVIPKSNVPEYLPALTATGGGRLTSTKASMAASETFRISDAPHYIKRRATVTLDAKYGTVGDIYVGFGDITDFTFTYVVVTASNIIIKRGSTSDFTVAHGLTLSTFIRVSFTMDWKDVRVSISTLSGSFHYEATYDSLPENYGTPFVRTSESAALTDVKLEWYSQALTAPVWCIGDSMMSLYEARWPYQLVANFGVKDFLVSALAGAQSPTLLDELNRMLPLGTPRFLFWGLGGNDKSWKWKDCARQVELLCRARGITLIYNRIPWRSDLEDGSREDINEYVVTSGYRYIDTYSAVSSDEDGTWFDGYCADGVHPTVLGARAIAVKILADFPEIMQ